MILENLNSNFKITKNRIIPPPPRYPNTVTNDKKNSKTGKWCYWHATDTHSTAQCRVASTCTKCNLKGHESDKCRTTQKAIKETVAAPATSSKPAEPTCPCRMCKSMGHYDADCPEFLKFQEFQKKLIMKFAC